MKPRLFFWASILFIAVAWGFQLAYLGQCSKSMVGAAHRVTAFNEHNVSLNGEIERPMCLGDLFGGLGLAFAGVSTACLAASLYRREAARRSIPATLLIGYLILLCVMV